nr:MAG TPA: hypothetical protein [Caudoviricetes sp.]
MIYHKKSSPKQLALSWQKLTSLKFQTAYLYLYA